MDFAEIMEIRDGLIQSHRVYWGRRGVEVIKADAYDKDRSSATGTEARDAVKACSQPIDSEQALGWIMLPRETQEPQKPIAGSERRVSPRRRMFKGGKVIFNDGGSVIDCLVRDLSATGARLTFPTPQALPQRFRLQVNEFGSFDCELVRVNGSDYGVRFVGTA